MHMSNASCDKGNAGAYAFKLVCFPPTEYFKGDGNVVTHEKQKGYIVFLSSRITHIL